MVPARVIERSNRGEDVAGRYNISALSKMSFRQWFAVQVESCCRPSKIILTYQRMSTIAEGAEANKRRT